MSGSNPPMNINMPYPVYAAYPPKGHFSSESESTLNFSSQNPLIHNDDPRKILRTPSPTQAEFNFLNGIKEGKTTRQKIQSYLIIAVILTIIILISVYNQKIVTALTPMTNWLHDHKFGFLIPIAILIVLSFPPLFGHEIIALLVGVAWDLPVAFVIIAVGTILGEIANYFTFKYACTARSEKLEAKELSYGLLAHVVRQGGFLMVLIIRFSAIPPHLATTVFATVGISFWTFLAAALLSLPKQLTSVYVGYGFKPSQKDNKTTNTVEKIVLVAGILVTIAAYVWVNRQMQAAKPDFIYARRKARQGKVGNVNGNGTGDANFPASFREEV
ncbi:hypothetical protein B0H17DRAFT_1047094 [Mycena rosella]|uniref:Golgi apparatus membrane protein TVP38 n=1 Tax=Mycena rosella TaxID=1033263 RepID=A0AAD7GP50_MYCRO|nr:hypothetical protein B0H17DRAFT_1047094 [Mycena rosella]